MSRNYRSERSEIVVQDETDLWTICVYFLVLVFMASLPFLSNDDSKQRHSKYAQICAADGEKRLSLIKTLPGYIGNDKETQERRKETNWCDLASQEKVANSARWSTISAWAVTILTLIGVILLGRTLIYTRRTLDEAREAANSAKEHIEIVKQEQRAWMVFHKHGIGKIINSSVNGVQVKDGLVFDVDFINVGRMPAHDVRIFSDYKIVHIGDSIPVFVPVLETEIGPVVPQQGTAGRRNVLNDIETKKFTTNKVDLILFYRVSYFDGVSANKQETQVCFRAAFLGGEYTLNGRTMPNIEFQAISFQNNMT